MATNTGHVLMFGNHSYGHTQACVPFAVKLVQLLKAPPVFTILATDPSSVVLFEAELAKYELEPSLRQLIRLSAVGECGPDFGALRDAYRTLEDSQPLKCTVTGVTHSQVPPPTIIIYDLFAYTVVPYIRSLSQEHGRKVLCYAWQSGGASGYLRWFGPEKFGGIGDLDAKMTTNGAVEGVDMKESGAIGDQIFLHSDGSPLTTPGLPPMYDYEALVQFFPFIAGISLHARFCYKATVESDGAILICSEAVEPEGIQGWREWLAESNKEIFVVYPPTPPQPKVESRLPPVAVAEKEADPGIDEIDVFLQKAVQKYGQHSLVYISFGTLFWTMEPEKVWALFDTLIELQIPFIFAHAAPFIAIPEEVVQKVKASGLGIMTSWAPQQFILLHPATGWFVTHASQNGRMESLAAGVPMICWPIHSEQTHNAMQLTLNLNVAYELFEVRSGPNAQRPLLRFEIDGKQSEAPKITGTLDAAKSEFRGVLEKARGEDGEMKRKNALTISEKMKSGWKEGDEEPGSALKDMKKFIAQAGLSQ